MAPYLHQFALYLVQIYHHKKNTLELHIPSKGAIWVEFSEQHQNQSMKKSTKFNAQLALSWLRLRCRFNANIVGKYFKIVYYHIITLHFFKSNLSLFPKL